MRFETREGGSALRRRVHDVELLQALAVVRDRDDARVCQLGAPPDERGSDAREIRNAGRGRRRRGDAYATLSISRPLQLFAIARMLGSVSLSQHLTRAKTRGVGRRVRESQTHRPRGKGGGARARESRTRPSRAGGGARGDARVARSSTRASPRAPPPTRNGRVRLSRTRARVKRIGRPLSFSLSSGSAAS